MRLQFAEGIGHFNGGPGGREAPLDERVGQAFVPTASGEGLAESQQAGMDAVGLRFGMQAGTQARGNRVESVQARDFLNKIDFTAKVVAKARRLPDHFAVHPRRSFLATEPFQIFLTDIEGNMDAKHVLQMFAAQLDRAATHRRCAGQGRGGGNFGAGQFHEKGESPVPRSQQRARVNAPLVAVRGIGNKAEGGGSCGAPSRVETTRLPARLPSSSR